MMMTSGIDRLMICIHVGHRTCRTLARQVKNSPKLSLNLKTKKLVCLSHIRSKQDVNIISDTLKPRDFLENITTIF